MAVVIKLVNTMWCSLVIKSSLLNLIGLFILNCVGVRNHWWRNPSLSAWNMGVTFSTLLFFCFHPSLSLPSTLALALLCALSAFHLLQLFLQIPRRISLRIPFPLYVLRKYWACLPSLQKVPDWNILLIEKGKGKKKEISPASQVRLPIQLFCLPFCFLIMLGLNTLRHLNQCLMLCCHCVHTSLPR